MKMIGEDNDSVDMERSLPPHGSERRTQGVNVFRQQAAAAFQQGNREKVGTAGHMGADVVRYGEEFAAFAARSKEKRRAG